VQRLARFAVWCERGEHSRCRSAWGAKPCRCRCHRGPARVAKDVLATALESTIQPNGDVLADVNRTATAIMTGDPHELRVICSDRTVISGVFATPNELAVAARQYDGVGGVYLGLNPTTLERHPARRVRTGEGVSDAQIARFDWLGLDLDPITDEDVFPVAAEITEYLTQTGFSDAGVVGDSGRGMWMLWRVNQDNTASNADLRRRFLLALKERWPQVDTSTYNASRVVRCFGTLNQKTNNRSVLYRVSPTEPVPTELLEEVAAVVRVREHPDRGVRGSVELILERLAEKGITVSHEHDIGRGTVLQLSACPFYPEKNHATAAALYRWNDGNVGFRCLGDACTAADNRIYRLTELLGIELVAAEVGGKPAWSRASSIVPVKAETTWDGRIVLHNVNLNVGDEGAGKGLLDVRLIAEATTGALLGHTVTVAYATTEEVIETVVVPRLHAAGADLDRVVTAPMGSLGLPDALAHVVDQLREAEAEWLFLDPVNSHFSAGLDPNRTKDVNLVLNLLAAAAAENRFTIVGNLHTNRGNGVSPRERYAHQSEFRRVARSSVIIGRGPEDGPDERTIVHDKHSYTESAPSLSATIEVVDGIATLVLGDVVDVTAEELFLRDADKEATLARVRNEAGRAATCAQEIMERWEALGRPTIASATEFSQIAKTYGATTVKRARDRTGIKAIPLRDAKTKRVVRWTWKFPT
jgi:hypothetical protein